MATETGTATGFIDLYTKLITFATTQLGGENWVQVYGYERHAEVGDTPTVDGSPTLGTQNVFDNKTILKGGGSGGADEIYVGLRTYYDPDVQVHTVSIQGLNSFDNTKVYGDQAVWSPACFSYVWDMTMAYWFVGSGRRIIAIARMGTIYQIIHFGFFLPYATPTEYPYPLLLGGCGNDENITFAATGSHNDFFVNGRWGSAVLYSPTNTFYRTGNYDTYGNFPYALSKSGSHESIYYLPYSAGQDLRHRLDYVRDTLDGSFILTPIEMLAQGGYGMYGILGLIDGLYQVSGFGNYSENTITVNGTDYIVFQRVYRTGVSSFVALRWD